MPERRHVRAAMAAMVLVAGSMVAAPATSVAAEPEPAADTTWTVCTPKVFAPGVVSTDANESRIAFTPDGRTAYFGRSDTPGALEDSSIYVTHRRHGEWTEPMLASFSGVGFDLDPFITADGRRLYFTSTRAVDGEFSGANLWYVERTHRGRWGEPRPLASVNSVADELYPSIADDGTLYFNSNREGSLTFFDLYRASPRGDGTFSEPESLGPVVNAAPLQFNPSPLPNNRGLIFASIGRPGSVGEIDLWVTLRTDDGWTEPRNLGAPFSTEHNEFHPSFGPRYGRFFFVRHNVETQIADLYSVPSFCLVRPGDLLHR